MKNTKKGFTLVELLVVIAILAILATVAIVGYTSFIDKANLSVDQQVVEQLNTALTSGSVGLSEDEITIENLTKIFADADFNLENGINALRSDNRIYWYKTYNTIVLADNAGKVIFPTDNTQMVQDFEANISAPAGIIYDLAKMVEDSAVVANGVIYASLEEALAAGGEITLFNDVSVTSKLDITKDTVLNLNGNNLDGSNISTSRLFNIVEDGVTLTINAEDAEIAFGSYGLVAMKGSTSGIINVEVVVNGGCFEGEMDNGAFIKAVSNVNATVTLNNVTYKDNTNVDNTNAGTQVSYITDVNPNRDATMNLTVNDGSYDADCGFYADTAEFNGVTINSRGYCIYALSATIDNCNLTTTSVHNVSGNSPAACVVTSDNGSVTIKNSTLNAGEGNATHVYPSGGTIELTGCAVTGNHYVQDPYAGKTSTIIVDGVATSKTGE